MGKQMKRTFLNILIFALAILSFSTCNDPIFYMVSREVEQLKPLIEGTPTNFVEHNNGYMYVASGKNIWEYKNGSWNRYKQGRWIAQLAATSNSLFALCDNDSVIRFNSSSPGINAKSIFAVDDVLFFSKKDGHDSYSIHYYDDTNSTTRQIAAGVSMLNGAVSGTADYFLCTSNGIYHIPHSSLSSGNAVLVPGSKINFTGIIKMENGEFVAITREKGELYKITTTGIGSSIASFSGERKSSGALAIWEDKNNSSNKLLLAGRQDNLTYTINSGYTYGYMEVPLDLSGAIEGSSLREPGTGSPSTVSSNESYTSSIGKNPVNHIFQADDGILFASTQKNGVWSYRMRDGEWQWNAEN
jgi:hypothetical protein